MAKKHVKDAPDHMSLVNCRSKQIYSSIPIKRVKIQNTDNTKCWQGCRAIEILIRCWWERKMVRPLKRQFLTKLDILLTYNPAITLFGFHTNEMKKYVHSKTCTCMLIPGLFVIVKTGKQPRGPVAGERINKLWCIQTMQYYFSITISELRSIKRHVGNLAVYF